MRDFRNYLIAVAVVVQALCVLVWIFGDIGFDHPGRFGLDYDDLVLLAIAYVVALLIACILAVTQGRTLLVAAQLFSPIAIFLVALFASSIIDEWSRLDAKEYQHLKGMTKIEVHQTLRDSPSSFGGSVHPGGDFEENYHGISVVYGPDDKVTGVFPNSN